MRQELGWSFFGGHHPDGGGRPCLRIRLGMRGPNNRDETYGEEDRAKSDVDLLL